MADFEEGRARLLYRFRAQESFAAGYSPLYSRLFGVVAGWLEANEAARDPLVAWLVEAAAGRRSLDVTLLLAAGLHGQILGGAPSASQLAEYFPTAGSRRLFLETRFAAALRRTIEAGREPLTRFIQTARVQTNETGRGLCWLLPLAGVGWEAVHLVDLGASAGLNLVADLRAYRLTAGDAERPLLDLGAGRPVQFITRCRGETEHLERLETGRLPAIAGRIGCDLAPFPLDTAEDEIALMSFIWGDQVERMARLREGIAARRGAGDGPAPVKLYPADLPGELGEFLRDRVPAGSDFPVVIYNTYMTPYLKDKGASLIEHISAWAARQARPVLWLQWEVLRDGRQAPESGWCVWTADLWRGEEHYHWLLGWVHPHGGAAEFGPGLGSWLEALIP